MSYESHTEPAPSVDSTVETSGVLTARMEDLASLFREAPVAVLTGAGVSTDSGIPDYRGAGTSPRTAMNITQFTTDPLYRRRFWAGASVNADQASHVQPNAGHYALAALESAGLTHGVITQNVDNLHSLSGSRNVVELHGNGSVIRCDSCGRHWDRLEVISWFTELNPGFVESQSHAALAPDGDARVTGFERVTVPDCPSCGGLLRPNVVYFGEVVPTEIFSRAEELLAEAGALLIAGSSLAVNTGIRLVHRAERRGIPIAVINRGPTAVDARAQIRIDGGTSETLGSLVRMLGA